MKKRLGNSIEDEHQSKNLIGQKVRQTSPSNHFPGLQLLLG